MPAYLSVALILAFVGFIASTVTLAFSPLESRRAAVAEVVGCTCVVLIAVFLALMVMCDLFLPA